MMTSIEPALKYSAALLSIDRTLLNNVMLMRRLVDIKKDNIVLVDGMEGEGKTTLAVIIASILSRGRFDVDSIVFHPDEATHWIDSPDRRRHDVMVWDEFVMTGLTTEAMTKRQNSIIKLMTIIRKKGLHILLVAPYLWMLRRYFAIARTRFLLHVYGLHALDRGKYNFYNYEQKKVLYLKGMKMWDYKSVRPAIRAGWFGTPDVPLIDWSAYERKKDAAMRRIDDESGGHLAQRNWCLRMLRRLGVGVKDLADGVGLSEATIKRIVEQ